MSDVRVEIERKRFAVIDGVWHPDHIKEIRLMPESAASVFRQDHPGSVLSVTAAPVEFKTGHRESKRSHYNRHIKMRQKAGWPDKAGCAPASPSELAGTSLSTHSHSHPPASGPLDIGALINKELYK